MALLLSNLLTTQNFNHASGRGLGTAFGRPLAAQALFGMTEISRGLGTAFGHLWSAIGGACSFWNDRDSRSDGKMHCV